MATAGADAFGYDAVGNQTSRPNQTLRYNPNRKVKSITLHDSGRTLGFEYDAFGALLVKSGEVGRTVYINGIYELVNPGTSGAVHRYHVSNGTAVVATVSRTLVNNVPTTSTQYFHHDALGSVDVVTDQAGTAIERYYFDAWGQKLQGSWGGQPSQPSPQTQKTDFGFTGHQHDEDFGRLNLVNMVGRHYDPRLGRFLQTDSVVPDLFNSQALNRYSYVYNSPTNLTDPTGNAPQEQPSTTCDVPFCPDHRNPDPTSDHEGQHAERSLPSDPASSWLPNDSRTWDEGLAGSRIWDVSGYGIGNVGGFPRQLSKFYEPDPIMLAGDTRFLPPPMGPGALIPTRSVLIYMYLSTETGIRALANLMKDFFRQGRTDDEKDRCHNDLRDFMRIAHDNVVELLSNYPQLWRSPLDQKLIVGLVDIHTYDRIDDDDVLFSRRAHIYGYEDNNYSIIKRIPLRPGLLFEYSREIARGRFGRKHNAMYLGKIANRPGIWYFDSISNKVKRFTNVGNRVFYFWRFTRWNDPWYGRE